MDYPYQHGTGTMCHTQENRHEHDRAHPCAWTALSVRVVPRMAGYTCRRLYERNPETDLRDLKEQLRPFMLAVRQENTFHAWGKNTPGKAATADDQSPWTENNVRGLEDFDDGEHQ